VPTTGQPDLDPRGDEDRRTLRLAEATPCLVPMAARAAAPRPPAALIRIDEHADSAACGRVAVASKRLRRSSGAPPGTCHAPLGTDAR
jgi:hypothetical protein